MCARTPLAERVRDVPSYPIERTNVEVRDKEAVMEGVRERVGDEGDGANGTDRWENEEVTTLDGVRIDTDDGWILVRASGTQPLIRVTAEARAADRAAELSLRGRELVENESE